MNNTKYALGIIDVDRTFFPAAEGERLNLPGFGELEVATATRVIEPINLLTEEFTNLGLPIFDTHDKHPYKTAHINRVDPDFDRDWPEHGRDREPGSLSHPDLTIAKDPSLSTTFIKGDVEAETVEDDTSYTARLAHLRGTEIMLPTFLQIAEVTGILAVGVALGNGDDRKLCVDSSAFDFKKLGFDVTVITDATEPVFEENRAKCHKKMGDFGIKLMTTAEAIEMVRAA